MELISNAGFEGSKVSKGSEVSKLCVKAQSVNIHRPARCVVSWMVDVLVISGEPSVLREAKAVETFKDIFWLVVE